MTNSVRKPVFHSHLCWVDAKLDSPFPIFQNNNVIIYSETVISNFQVIFTSVSKRVLVHKLSYGNEFDLQSNEIGRKTHFHMKGCAPRPVLKQAKATRKWPIIHFKNN